MNIRVAEDDGGLTGCGHLPQFFGPAQNLLDLCATSPPKIRQRLTGGVGVAGGGNLPMQRPGQFTFQRRKGFRAHLPGQRRQQPGYMHPSHNLAEFCPLGQRKPSLCTHPAFDERVENRDKTITQRGRERAGQGCQGRNDLFHAVAA